MTRSLGEWLEEAPFTLALSAGYFGYYAHAGCVAALIDAGLVPSRGAGSSSGALVMGAWAAGLDVDAMREAAFALRREDFWDPSPGLGLLRGRRFRAQIESLLPVSRFEDCRIPMAISTFDALACRTRVFTRGELAPAIQASCSLPLLFAPVWIDRRPHLDGGVRDRPGLAGVDSGERVLYHHLLSRKEKESRRRARRALPARHGLVSLIVEDLPSLGPKRLTQGPEAYAIAHRKTTAALAAPLVAHEPLSI